MRYRLHVAALTSAAIFVAACSQSQTPTSPSRVSSVSEPGAASSLAWATMSQNSQAQVVDWSCMTTGAGCVVLPLPTVLGEDPPNAPSNLAFSLSGSTVVLTWSPPAPGPTTTSYVLQAGSGPGLSNIVSFNTGSTATTFTATNVPAGTYFARVRASNGDGAGAPSNEVTIVVGSAPCPAPGAPTGLTGSASGSTVNLQWASVANAIAYIIEAGSAPGASNLASFDTGSAATSFSATAPNGTYYLRIRVRTSCGTSGVSNEVTVVVGGSPPPPTSVTGRWVGLVANGDGTTLTTPACGLEQGDWQLDLTQTGSTVTGTLTQTTRVSTMGCDPIGLVRVASLTGTAGSGTFSFTIQNNPSRTGNATFTASRMTGSTSFAGTFAVNRQ